MQEFFTGAAARQNQAITYYGAEGFDAMRKAGQLASRCLDDLYAVVKPGVTTQAIDDFILTFGMDHGAFPATLNYRGYRKASCISINHVVCHGLPNEKPLREGDILNIDVTYVLDGWHGDSSRMYCALPIKRAAERLIEVTYECLMRGVAAAKPGNRLGDIGHAIQSYAEGQRCSVVRDFCGHGVGRFFHEPPNILHYGQRGEGQEMKPGMIFTIEPMINLGRAHVKLLSDGWTAVTRDRALSAQFEHTVGITETGAEIFTLSPAGRSWLPWENA
jgi:methionyl aminopeptidase